MPVIPKGYIITDKCCDKTRFYDTFEDFPETGLVSRLYVDRSTGAIYIWDGTEYTPSGGPTPVFAANVAAFPLVGEVETLYIDESTGAVYIWDGADYITNSPTLSNNLPWVEIGQTEAFPTTDIDVGDNIFRTGKTTLGSNQTPLSILHVGNYNNNPSTDSKILVSHNVVGLNAEHAFSDGSIINNSNSYNSYDSRITINSDITGLNGHYAAFQNITTINSGKTVTDIYGFYDGSLNSGTVTNYYGSYLRATSAVNYRGISVISGGNPSTATAFGFEAANLNAPSAIGFSVSGINGSTTTRGVSVTGLQGTARRPFYSEHNESYSPNEFKFTQSGNADLLVFSRGSVNDGNYMGMTWEAGSGATKYYSNRLASVYNNSLQGDFIFFTNPTGNSGLGSLLEKARIRYDGSFIHEGYHQFTSGLATTGATAPNGSLFKGTDGALYYKGGAGTVTLIGPN